MLRFSFGYIATWFTSRMCGNFQDAAVRAWIQRLAIFIAWKSFPFWLRVPTFLTLSESRFTSSAKQVSALFAMHCTGILQHGAGIA
jgi:hypothetical protein